MPGALLRTGSLQEFRALGVDGQPVCGAALQLREAIRLKVGREAADCLAIPQSNENGDVIDWYAPYAGDVVPWSAATPEERSSAFEQLEQVHKQLREYSQQMQRESQNREKLLFGRLLEKALYFPDPSQLYLVEGKPVVTFWGFADRNASEGQDPLLDLRPVAPRVSATVADAPIPPIAEPRAAAAGAAPLVEPVRRGWGWLWTLLGLLLLLLLLLFLMRACAPTVTLPFGLSQIEIPGLPPVKEEPKLPEGTVVEEPVWWRTGVVGSVVNAVTGTDTAGSAVTAGDAALDKGAALTEEQAAKADLAKEGAVPPEGMAGDKANPEGQNAKDGVTPAEQPNAAKDAKEQSPQPPKDLLGNDLKANANNPANKDAAKNQPPLPPELNNQAGGKPLNIPADAAKSGTTNFLDGSWKAGSGIQDARTGKPMQLDYRFDDGKGQVVVRGSNGLECKGNVNAAMQGGQLAISNQGQATCNDGSQYKLPEVLCAPGGGSADCTGRYGNQQFPLSMKQGSQ